MAKAVFPMEMRKNQPDIGFYLSFKQMQTSAGGVSFVAPNISGYEMIKIEKVYGTLVANNAPVAWLKIDNEENVVSGTTPSDLLNYPGGRYTRANLVQHQLYPLENDNIQRNYGDSAPGSFKGRNFMWKPTDKRLSGWQPLTGLNIDVAWKEIRWFTVRMEPCDITNGNSMEWRWYSDNDYVRVLFRLNVYLTVGQWCWKAGQPNGFTKMHTMFEPDNANAREDNYIKTECDMHRMGSTDCIDLTGLDIYDE